jgi:hypothetical protein
MRNRAGDQHRYLSAKYFEADGELWHKYNDIVITDKVLGLQYTRSASMDRRTMRRLDHSEELSIFGWLESKPPLLPRFGTE